MEYRKLIKFGTNSFVISLPKPWIIKNKLEKGALIYLTANSNQLVLSPQRSKQENNEKTITLDCRNEKIETIQRKIVASYINNYKEIRVMFNDVETSEKIRTIIQNLMALEVIEQNQNMIIAKDYLNINDIAVGNLIRKSDNIIRTMFKDFKQSLTLKGEKRSELAHNIYTRDTDINRLTFVIMRAVKYVLSEPGMKKEGSDVDYFYYYEMSQSLERLADVLKRIAIGMDEKGIKQTEEILDIMEDLERMYINIMKTYYNKDIEGAFKVATEKNMILEKIKKYKDMYSNNTPVLQIFDTLRNTLRMVHGMGRLVYQ